MNFALLLSPRLSADLRLEHCVRKLSTVGKISLISAICWLGSHNLGSAVEMNVPVLAVRELADGKLEGSLHTVAVSVTDRKVQKPLAVSVAEDSPSAVGAQMRTAVWLAATTVALERGHPLTGYRIEIAFDGRFDGPSAGGVVALALLSALDQRVLPADFAFTGAILPNGGVGQVGGVAQKIEAAAKAGKKRILVPDFYRVETDPHSGKKVDFKDLCESLGLEYLPVSNLRDAYRAVYRLNETREPRSDLKLPAELEKFLKESYAKEMAVGDKIFKALPDAEKDGFQEGPGKMFLKARSDAENAMQEGNFSLAEENAVMWSILLSARQRNQDFLKSLKVATSGDVVDSISKEIDRGAKEAVANLSSYSDSRSWTNRSHSSEMDSYCREVPIFLGLTASLSFQTESLLEDRKKIAAIVPGFWDRFKSGPSRDEQLEALNEQIFPQHLLQLLFINVSRDLHDFSMNRMKKLSQLYKVYSPEPQAFHMDCENLVYNAAAAADNSFTADTLQEAAKAAGVDIDEAKAKLALNSVQYLSLVVQRELCAETHEKLKRSRDFYAIALATQDHGFALTAATRMVLTVQCGGDKDENGTATYSNKGLLRALLESSRNEALISIARCESAGIPCWNPTMLVLAADGKREDASEDRMDVLEAYLQASVQAKILKMLFTQAAPGG